MVWKVCRGGCPLRCEIRRNHGSWELPDRHSGPSVIFRRAGIVLMENGATVPPMSVLANAASALIAQLDLHRRLPIRLYRVCEVLGAEIRTQPGTTTYCVRIVAGEPVVFLRCVNTYRLAKSPELRFVLAHELGHVYLFRKGVPQARGRSEYFEQEKACDLFARCLLCPDNGLRNSITTIDSVADSIETVLEVAKRYQVPVRIAADRFSDLNASIRFALFRRKLNDQTEIRATASSFGNGKVRGTIFRQEDTEFQTFDSVDADNPSFQLAKDMVPRWGERLRLKEVSEIAIRRIESTAWLVALQQGVAGVNEESLCGFF